MGLSDLTQSLLCKASMSFHTEHREFISQPSCAARSHVERQQGVFHALPSRWHQAAKSWRRSLQLHGWNASSEHLLGLYYIQFDDLAEAQNHLARSLYMDPEWKATYVNLSYTFLKRDNHRAARKVAEEGLKRFPNTPHAAYNLGCAVAKSLQWDLIHWSPEMTSQKDGCLTKIKTCMTFLAEARDQKDIQSGWNENDDSNLSNLGELAVLLEKRSALDDKD